jgi:hypothetical protein
MTLNPSITHSLGNSDDEGEITLPGISEGEIVVLA